MLGSIFIATNRSEDLKGFDIENMDSFCHISLEDLVTLDFELALQGTGIEWVHGQPIVYEEDAGIAIFQINPAGLKKITEPNCSLKLSHPEDISTLIEFIVENNSSNIYEVATF